MLLRSLAPPASLAHLVRGFHAFDDVHDDTNAEHRLYPECSSSLAFLDGRSWFEDPSSGELVRVPNVFIERPRPAPVRLVSRGRTRMVGVNLYLWGVTRLLGPTTDDVSLVGAGLAAAMQRLLAESELDEALHRLAEFVAERARDVDLAPSPAIRVAMDLYASHGHGSILEMADRAGVSVRQLERQFHEQVGMSPKRLARVIRFEEAQTRIWNDPDVSLTWLAHELGYADQAHFSREFRALAFITPTQHAASARADHHRDVAFVQGSAPAMS